MLSTRCAVTVTLSTIMPSVSVIKMPFASAVAVMRVTAVFNTAALLPIPLPAFNTKPLPLIRLAPSIEVISTPAIRAILPAPALMVSLLNVPVVASTRK